MKIKKLINSVYMEDDDQKKIISRFLHILRTEVNYDKDRVSNFIKDKITFDLYTANSKIEKNAYGAFFHAISVYLLDDNFRKKLNKPPKGFSKKNHLWRELLIFCTHLKKGPQGVDESLIFDEIERKQNNLLGQIYLEIFEKKHGKSLENFIQDYKNDRNFLYIINILKEMKK